MLRQNNWSRRGSARAASTIALVAAIVIAGAIVLYRQTILDHINAWQYQASSATSAIRNDLALTSEGKLYFDASHTAVQPAGTFNQSCQQRKETNNPILGCYYLQKIYVFDVTNKKLEGIEQTTTAHEILHAAYERMSPDEQSNINVELRAAYEKVKNKELEERMEYYQKTEPGEENNELHSILGTEFSTLSQNLERHYKKYFVDRARVVGFYNNYSKIFSSAKDKLSTLRTTINKRTDSINSRISSYNSATSKLKNDVESFNASANSGDFSSQADFAASRATLLSRQNALNQTRQKINSDISAVNTLKAEFNSVAKEYNALNASINSSLTPTLKLDSAK